MRPRLKIEYLSARESLTNWEAGFLTGLSVEISKIPTDRGYKLWRRDASKALSIRMISAQEEKKIYLWESSPNNYRVTFMASLVTVDLQLTDEKSPKEFGGEGAEQYNAMHQAFHHAATRAGHTGEYREYVWIEETPRTSMIVGFVDALNDLGFEITKEKQEDE